MKCVIYIVWCVIKMKSRFVVIGSQKSMHFVVHISIVLVGYDNNYNYVVIIFIIMRI